MCPNGSFCIKGEPQTLGALKALVITGKYKMKLLLKSKIMKARGSSEGIRNMVAK